MLYFSEIEKDLEKQTTDNFREKNYQLFSQLKKTCIIIDDDPTGNQTVHGVPLLTQWDVDTLEDEFKKQTPLFFLLTNSRSLTEKEVVEIYTEVAKNIVKAAKQTGRDYTIISRGDSTLRGHFYTEVSTIKNIINNPLTVFAPVMFEGGRVTVNDIHYIKEKNQSLIPVSESSFANDHTFGYENSNLKKWIKEKTAQKNEVPKVHSFSVNAIRKKSVHSLSEEILKLNAVDYCIINALNYSDLDKIAQAFLLAEASGKEILYRTSSSFVPSYVGMASKDLLQASEIVNSDTQNGALIIVGSYVSKSSEQLKCVLEEEKKQNVHIELNTTEILSSSYQSYLRIIIHTIEKNIKSGNNIILSTSRAVKIGSTKEETIAIAKKISNALIAIVQQISCKPRYILSKGGITSHDIATKGLKMKKSITIGQVLPGIPVWQMGEETKFPNIGYIVFPGNVGEKDTLKQLINKLT